MADVELGQLIVRLRADSAALEAGLRQADQRLAGMESAMKQRADNISRSFAGLGSVLATVFSARQLGESIRRAQHNLETLAQLRSALRTTGNFSLELEQALRQQASALEMLTGVSDETVMAVQRLLLSLKVSASEVQQLTPLVLDLATAMGTDPVNAARMLGRAIGGEMTEGLRRYGIQAKTVSGIIHELQTGFAGQAAASFRARGELAALSVFTENLKEELGKLILPSLNRFLEGLVERIRHLNAELAQARQQHPDIAASLDNLAAMAGKAAAAFGPEALALGGALLAVRAVLFVFGPLIRGLTAAFAALLAPLISAARALGVTGAALDRLRALFMTGAAATTRLAAAAELAAAGFGALLAALTGFAIGKAIGQIQVLGKTIEDHIVTGIFKAQQAWARFQAFVGLISKEELAKREEFFKEALKPPAPVAAAAEAETEGAPGPPRIVPADELTVLQGRAELLAHLAKVADTDVVRLEMLRWQHKVLGEIVNLRSREYQIVADAVRQEEGRVIETEEFIKAQREMNRAVEDQLEIEKAIRELEQAPTRRFHELLGQLGEDPRELALPFRSTIGMDPTLAQSIMIQSQMDLERDKIRQLEEFSQKEVGLTQEAQEEKAAIIERINRRILALQQAHNLLIVRSGQEMFESLSDAARGWAGEQSGIYKAMFAASKAFAIAESIIKIQQAIANASASLPFPANLIAIAQVIAATANIVSTIQSVTMTIAGERARGGPVQAGRLFLVGERGPELFAPASDGTILPNEVLRRSEPVRVVVNNYSEAPVRVQEREAGNERVIEVLIGRLKRELSGEIVEGQGVLTHALERAYGLRRRAA